VRVLHVGNIANNAYLNAKLQRRAGVEADALCDEWHVISQPEWEDADLAAASDDYESLVQPAAERGWRRPEWVLELRSLDPAFSRGEWLRERLLALADLPGLTRRLRSARARYEPLRGALGHDLGLLDLAQADVWKRRLERRAGSLGTLFSRYDVVQLYGLHPVLLPLDLPAVPYVAFEHGTMREIPFENTWRGRALALGYREAARVIITNADVVEQARLLGLENNVFVPHPLDETKYTPGPSRMRAELEGEGFDFMLLSPSRHDWAIKGTDRLLHAFAKLVRSERPRAVLLLSDWGQEAGRSRSLVDELGIGSNVRWSRPLPKLRLIDAYRAADVVLDQFLIGTFGAVAPEAMACGCPVVMAFRPELHAWCFPELPPVVDARTTEDVHEALARLAEDAARREALGRQGREWIERNHGWRLVVDRQLAIYEQLAAGSAG
jgi:glycosyltransferase involved in cell wall biosynthesis